MNTVQYIYNEVISMINNTLVGKVTMSLFLVNIGIKIVGKIKKRFIG